MLEFLGAERVSVWCVVVNEYRKSEIEEVSFIVVGCWVSNSDFYWVDDVVREMPLVDAEESE